jgi:hypothetical protein
MLGRGSEIDVNARSGFHAGRLLDSKKLHCGRVNHLPMCPLGFDMGNNVLIEVSFYTKKTVGDVL